MSSGAPDEKKSSRGGLGGWRSNIGLITKVSFAFFGTIFILIIIVGALNYGTITTTDNGPPALDRVAPDVDIDDGPDLASDDSQLSNNAKLIALELTTITPAEVSQYPIANLSREEIVSVLELLNPQVLAKVLLNIPQEDLETIQFMLTQSEFNQTLNRLVDEDRTQVEDRLKTNNV